MAVSWFPLWQGKALFGRSLFVFSCQQWSMDHGQMDRNKRKSLVWIGIALWLIESILFCVPLFCAHGSIPYCIRLRQCLTEYIESNYTVERHLMNALKYASAFPVIIISSMQKSSKTASMKGVEYNGYFSDNSLFRLWYSQPFYFFIQDWQAYWIHWSKETDIRKSNRKWPFLG